MRAGQLVVDIAMNVARLQQDVEQATGIVTTASKKIEGVANTAQKALAGIAAGFTVGAFVSMIKETVAMEAGLYKLAQAAGTTVEALSSIKGVAKQSDTSLETVAAGMQKLSKTMAEATDGTSKAAKVFTALGIATNDASGALRPSQVVMQELGQKLMQMKDQTLAVAFAQETMGKAGANLLPFLYELAQAGTLQVKVTTEQAKAAQDFEDNLKKLEASGNKWKLSLVNSMTPALVEYTDKLLAATKASGNLAAGIATMLTAKTGGNIGARMKELDALIESSTADTQKSWWKKGAVFNGGIGTQIDVGRMMAERDYLHFVQRQQALAGDPNANMDARDRRLAGGTLVANPLGKDAPPPPPAPPPRDDFSPLAKSLDERIALMKAERDATQPLSEAQKELVKVQTDLTLGYKTLTPAQMESVKGKLAEVDALDQLLKFKAMQTAADKAELQRQKDRLNAQFSAIDATDAEISKLRESTQEIGLSASQLDRLRLSRIDDQIAIKDRQLAQAEANSADASYTETLRIQAEQLRTLRDLTADNQFRTAVDNQNKLQRDEFKRTSEYIQRSLTDALMRGFDSGKTFAQNLRDTTVNMFKTLILEPIIRPITGAMAGAVTSAIGLGGFSGAASAASGIGGIGNLASFGSNLFGGGQAIADIGNFFGSIGSITEAGSTFGLMDALGGFAMANPWLAAGAIALPLLGGLFGEGGGPKQQDLYWNGGNFAADNITSQNPAFYSKVDTFSRQLLNDYTPAQLQALNGLGVSAAAGTDENQLFAQLQQAVAGALAGVKSISQLAAETAAWTKTLDTAKEALRAAQDPTGYWGAQVAKLQTQLGASASTLEDWRAQFLAALETAPDQETFTAWQALGNALDQVSKSASKAAQTVALTSASFATLVDFTRYQRLVANGIQVDSRGIAIPHFAGGGDHTGGLRLVGERGPELEFTGPSRIMNNAASRNFFDATGIINAIAQLQASVRAENMAIVRNTSEVARLSKRWDGEGMPGLRITDDAVRVNVTESVPVPVA